MKVQGPRTKPRSILRWPTKRKKPNQNLTIKTSKATGLAVVSTTSSASSLSMSTVKTAAAKSVVSVFLNVNALKLAASRNKAVPARASKTAELKNANADNKTKSVFLACVLAVLTQTTSKTRKTTAAIR